jgi:hypothetical protein
VAPLYDAYGCEVYSDGVTHDSIRDAIQAASRADDWRLAAEIAERYGWSNVCLYCAEATFVPEQCVIKGRVLDISCPICAACKEILDPAPPPDFADTKIYMQGLISRDVQ